MAIYYKVNAKLVCRNCGSADVSDLSVKSECLCDECLSNLSLAICFNCCKAYPQLNQNYCKDRKESCWKCNMFLSIYEGKVSNCQICNVYGAFNGNKYCLHCFNGMNIFNQPLECQICRKYQAFGVDQCYKCVQKSVVESSMPANKKRKLC